MIEDVNILVSKIKEELNNGSETDEMNFLKKCLKKQFESFCNESIIYSLPFDFFLDFIKEYDFLELTNSIPVVKTVITQSIEHYSDNSLLLLKYLNCADCPYTIDDCVDIISLYTDCPFIDKMCQLYYKERDMIEPDWEMNIEEKDNIISDLAGQLKKKEKPADYEPDILKACQNGKLSSIQYLYEQGLDINDRGAFNEACKSNHIDIVQFFIKHCPQKIFNDGESLFIALQNKNYDIAKLLIEKGANVNPQTSPLPIGLAAQEGNNEIVELLIEKGAKINEIAAHLTPMTIAVANKQFETLKLLYDSGADINLSSECTDTPLTAAVKQNNFQYVKYLVEHGADVTVPNLTDSTPLSIALQNSFHEIYKYLRQQYIKKVSNSGKKLTFKEALEYNVLPSIKHYIEEEKVDPNMNIDGQPPLELVSTYGSVETIKYLLEKGAKFELSKSKNMITNAVKGGNIDVIGFLIEQGVEFDPETKPHDLMNKTPLAVACQTKQIDVVQFLLEKGARPNEVAFFNCDSNMDYIKLLLQYGGDVNILISVNEYSLIYEAYSHKNKDLLRYLIEEAHADINIKSRTGWTLLHFTAQAGKLDYVEYLIDHGADIDAQDNDGNSPFMLACLSNRVDVYKYLHDKGADINIQTKRYGTPLTFATSWGWLNLAQLLIEWGANIEGKDCEDHTPLNIAVNNGKVEFVELLCSKGANINSKNENEMTYLHIASQNADFDVAKILIDQSGCEINATDSNGKTALHYASQANSLKIVEYLIEHGATINSTDNEGNTPLIYACDPNNVQIIKYLCEKGADVTISNKKQNTALHVLCEFSLFTMAKLLLDLGANPNAQNSDLETPLHIAVKKNAIQLSRLLCNRGADLDLKNSAGNTALQCAKELGFSELYSYIEKIDPNVKDTDIEAYEEPPPKDTDDADNDNNDQEVAGSISADSIFQSLKFSLRNQLF